MLCIGMLNAEAKQPKDAYELDRALWEWRLFIEKKYIQSFKTNYQSLFNRHLKTLEDFGAVLAPDLAEEDVDCFCEME